jgi:predicted hydrolase (HD superfamily)
MTAEIDAAEQEIMLAWQKQHRTHGKPPDKLWDLTLDGYKVLLREKTAQEALDIVSRHAKRKVSDVESAFARRRKVRDSKSKIIAKAKAQAYTPPKPLRVVTLQIGQAKVTGAVDDVLHIIKQLERRV